MIDNQWKNELIVIKEMKKIIPWEDYPMGRIYNSEKSGLPSNYFPCRKQ